MSALQNNKKINNKVFCSYFKTETQNKPVMAFLLILTWNAGCLEFADPGSTPDFLNLHSSHMLFCGNLSEKKPTHTFINIAPSKHIDP